MYEQEVYIMYSEKLNYVSNHPHWRVEDVFKISTRLAKGGVQKNYCIGMHTHDFYEINIVLCGEGMHYIGERRTKAEVGDIFIIPPRVSHGYEGGESFDVYHLTLSPGYLEKYSAELHQMPAFSALFRVEPVMREHTSAQMHLHLSEGQLNELRPYLDSLLARMKSSSTEDIIIGNCEALIIITMLCAAYDKKLAEYSENGDDEAFLQSIAYIYEHYNQKISIESLSKMARMSRTSYIDRFKRATGLPPGEFITKQRISAAKAMLRDTSLSISEIAHTVGFYDSSHLIRSFESLTGESPSNFRLASKPQVKPISKS